MEVVLKITNVLRSFVKHSGETAQVIVDQETIDKLDAEIDQAEADEAFREVIRELCSSYGMAPDDKPYFYLKRKLAQRNAPDLRLICELAKVCADHGIQEGEDPATFLESKCREVDRLTEELESTQHKLADAVSDAESDYDQDDCVAECMADDKCNLIVRDIHVNTSKCVAELIASQKDEHSATRSMLTQYAVGIILFSAILFGVLVTRL